MSTHVEIGFSDGTRPHAWLSWIVSGKSRCSVMAAEVESLLLCRVVLAYFQILKTCKTSLRLWMMVSMGSLK